MPNPRAFSDEQLLAFSDRQLRILRDYARPLMPPARKQFLERVARLLQGENELGDGVIARACKVAQGELLARPEAAIDGTDSAA
jgi:hypothetical protein